MLQYGIVFYRSRHRYSGRGQGLPLAWSVGAGLIGAGMVIWGVWMLRTCVPA